ncbi:MAG: DUF2851 family protein [Candidatus Neomarinimicrobiota bacterium]
MREPVKTEESPEREADLYAQWERSAGRTVWGLGGQYRIFHQGKRNGGPGPDYLDATIAFPDGQVRRGDVEIHRRWNDWYRHRHQTDPRYRLVILHVIAAGPFKAVSQNQWRVVPTVPLPREPESFQALCHTIPQALDGFTEQDDFIQTLAMQRWWRRLAAWNDQDTSAVWNGLARRLGPDHHRLDLVRHWLTLLPGEKDLPAFLSGVVDYLGLGDGGSFRRGLPGRVICLSALAFMYHHTPQKLWKWSLVDVRQLVRDLAGGGYSVPSRPFLVEVVGNWLLPLSSSKTGTNRFREWYQLPLGWPYGRVRRHVERLGLRRPASFGEQQGLLEWIETLCQPFGCDWCPVIGVAGDR